MKYVSFINTLKIYYNNDIYQNIKFYRKIFIVHKFLIIQF